MSMRVYPVETYGLLVYAEDLQDWWDKRTENYGTENFVKEEVELFEINECLEYGYAHAVYDAEGTTYSINDKGCPGIETSQIGACGEDFVILELEKFPSLFEAAYTGKTEAIQELKNLYSEILPLGFDYEQRFVCYMGTEYC